MVDGAPVAWAPAFLGANPAEVREGSLRGLRALAPEEDLARELVRSLDGGQRAQALVDTEAPRDIITGNALEVGPLEPAGISINELRPDQVDAMVRLIDEYLSRIGFAWAGSLEVGEPHYYRVQGPTFLIIE